MGDRANFGFRNDRTAPTINLYGHWAGGYQTELMAFALDRSRERWTDTQYATRIAVSTIVGPDWASPLGWGLAVDEFGDNEYPYLLADWAARTVYQFPTTGAHTGKNGFQSAMDMEPSKTWSFDEFIEAHLPATSAVPS